MDVVQTMDRDGETGLYLIKLTSVIHVMVP